ncbi:DUF4219 domain-containing protein, partial [Cephalotus follicularis]
MLNNLKVLRTLTFQIMFSS